MMDKQYNHSQSEQQAQQKWQAEQTYTAQNNPGPDYSIDTPPPTISGSLHIGHIFSYTQTDIIARYKRMNGFSVFYPFGFDDNGLPTERYVEKKREVSSFKLGRSEFIKICLQETHEAEAQFINLWQRMGLSADWSMVYSTISNDSRKLSQESFITLFKKGFIYRKHEPALFCTTCRTSVAQAELDDSMQNSFFNDIVFQDAQGNDLIIGTTRPELLPSCVALFYNPNDERYAHLKGTQATVPLFGFTVPILADDAVSIEKGTGLVMCCTFGDKTDILWYKKYNLPYKQSIGFDGIFLPSTGILAGLKVPAAREKVIAELRDNNLLLNQRAISHAVNVHERCKKEIEYLALPQWFLNILDHKQNLLKVADKINWYPSFMKTRYIDWVEHLGWDWCLSRQRFFGIPFPAWHCKDCGEILLADIDQLPIDPQETPYNKPCPKCGKSDIVADTDVMDTWNTSSITPYILEYLKNPENGSPFQSEKAPDFLPMSMRPQAHDIIRTWAFYTIAKAWMHNGIIPWKDIVISGHVLGDTNEKLSKSKGGGKLAPETLLTQYSADVIRYWTASGSLGYDVAFSENQLKIGNRLVTKLWNAFRFVGEHQPESVEQPKDLGLVNQWMLHQATMYFNKYQAHLENYEFGSALMAIEPFFWNDFCDNYLELIKNQLFNSQEYDAKLVAATKWTLNHVGLRILQLYAPYLPHITETIYIDLYQPKLGTASIHQTRFADVQTKFDFDESARITDKIITITSLARKLKTEKQLSLKAPLATLKIHSADQSMLDRIKEQEQIIRGITHAQIIEYIAQPIEAPTMTGIDDQWHAQVGI